MASISSIYWLNFGTAHQPPEYWPRVFTPYIDMTLFKAASLWCENPEVVGLYCWTRSKDVPGLLGEEQRLIWAFSDPQVAFEFKMRFG